MSQKVKLIWDFRGEPSAKIAEHHKKHLDEYIQMGEIEGAFTSVEKVNDMHHIAFMVVTKNWMNSLREQLKPHRGQLYTEN